MRLAFAVLKYFPFGGLERDMLRMAECCAARGHEVVIFTSQWTGGVPPGGRIDVRILKLKSLASHSRAAEFERKFQKSVSGEHFDVKVAFNRIGGCDFYFAADNCYAVEMPKKHASWILKLLPRYRTFLRLEYHVFAPEAATKIFYLTPHQKEDFIRSYGTPEERFLALPPGINPECRRTPDSDKIRAEKRIELGIAPDEILLLQVASNYLLKGGDRSSAALRALPENLRTKCRLVFAGVSLGKRQKKDAAGLEERILFLGGRKDVPQLLCAADILVHPARNEATGTVLAEAISSGVPLIASSVCGFRNLVRDAGGIVLPEPWDQACLNRELRHMIEQLPACRQHALEHAGKADFCRRAEAAAEFMEHFADSSVQYGF